MTIRALAFSIAVAAASPASAQAFNPAPWLADLQQARLAFEHKYANRDWLEQEREVKLDALFDDLQARLGKARNEREAKAVFERLQRRIGDGHVEIEWPQPKDDPPAAGAKPAAAPDLCAGIGYDAHQNGPGTAQALDGYRSLPAAPDSPFDAGIVPIGGDTLGIVRIGVFMPQGFPELCRRAVRELAIPADKPCGDECQDHILTAAYRRLTAALEERAKQLKAAGATVLMVDISNNGGGSEWAEAAVRIFSARPLVSERRGFTRTPHWVAEWRELAAELRAQAKSARRSHRKQLLEWAAQADAAAVQAGTPCTPAASGCSRIGQVDFATGFVGSAPSGTFDGKEWAVYGFSPAQFDYHDGVWDGPLVVLVDQETWSAAEEFAAVLQDNRAAVILGARTGGAGCGYTNGGDPTTLSNSGAVLKLPDCVRFRADGSNEVRGIIPDELVGIRASDGVHLRARMIAGHLPAAIAKARALGR